MGVSQTPGVCQAPNCAKHNHELVECNCTDGLHNGFKKKGISRKVSTIILLMLLLAGLIYSINQHGITSFSGETRNQEKINEASNNTVSEDYTASGQFFDMTSGTPVPTKATLQFSNVSSCLGDCSNVLPVVEQKEVVTDEDGGFEVTIPVKWDTVPSISVYGYMRLKINDDEECSLRCNIQIKNSKAEMSILGVVKTVVDSNPINIKLSYNQKVNGVSKPIQGEYLDYYAMIFRCIDGRPCGNEEVKGLVRFLSDGTHTDVSVARKDFRIAPSYPNIPKNMECIFEYSNVKQTGCNIDLGVVPASVKDIKVTVNSEY